ncbi:MAG TPA: chromate resistance protein ChrB domain-containing protein [Gemmatimonadaceae bacterium]|nr:chromate resistance protein ChrB domain-containing protein [Gemmatimonadaceae bacterium]
MSRDDSPATTVPPSGLRGQLDGTRWLLLIHQLPPKPDYFRVKIGRRLQRVGAVAIKNSVYVLPHGDEAYEDFQWIVREIAEGGGEASVCEASFLEGLTNDAVVALFRDARDRDYGAIIEEASRVMEAATSTPAELTRLRRRFTEVAALDFFGAGRGPAAEAAVARAEKIVREASRRAGTGRRESTPGTFAAAATDLRALRARTWVTRRAVHVDRIASAWLIRHFVDPAARFKFVAPAGYVPQPGELRFDMFDAELTHEGDRCTFETLLERLGLDDPALRAVAEIVHDVDCKDGKFGRPEAAGIAALIDGIAAAHEDDAARLERGGVVFSDLHAHFAARAGHGRPPRA